MDLRFFFGLLTCFLKEWDIRIAIVAEEERTRLRYILFEKYLQLASSTWRFFQSFRIYILFRRLGNITRVRYPSETILSVKVYIKAWWF